MFRRGAESITSLLFPFYTHVHKQQLKDRVPLGHPLLELFHAYSGMKNRKEERRGQGWRFLLFASAAFLLYAGLTANAQVAPGTPSFVPQDCHEFDCIDLLNNNVILNATIRNKSGLFPMNAMLSMDSYMQEKWGEPFYVVAFDDSPFWIHGKQHWYPITCRQQADWIFELLVYNLSHWRRFHN